ncbi:GIY-YIG nuclease family protein [Sphingobium fluviale]|uniref:GIY-YIG nuclease family protein n=1 Tax=Sphingobium fluviale TaxID=2506423 RepID=A0A4Q1KF98_9SPHN|nr:GIY-YIG nuclease family protein [Sphingobium fluviale]RXR27634.1 GIY-YIG nuclease family protein [Sphingobium fluviale]
MRGGWTYIMTNKPCGVLYVGVTSRLHARIEQHKRGKGSEFCRRYNLHTLVLAERHERIEDAIAREKAMKAWKREWKIRLIEEQNPEWRDLFSLLA